MINIDKENKWAQEFPDLDRDNYSVSDVNSMLDNIKLAHWALEHARDSVSRTMHHLIFSGFTTDIEKLSKEFFPQEVRLLSDSLRRFYNLGEANEFSTSQR
jgi:hypothetical protein